MKLAEIMEDYSEKVDYRDTDFPVKAWRTNNSKFLTLSYVNHWHSDYELMYVVEGQMKYNVNGEVVTLDKGTMIFVSSGNMHFGFQEEFSLCEVIGMMFHPSVISDRLSSTQLSPYLLFSSECFGDTTAIECVKNIFGLEGKTDVKSRMKILSELFGLCSEIAGKDSSSSSQADTKQLETMRRMTGFVQRNYAEKISLNDIAAAGSVCRSRCCKIFREFLGKSPVEYLTEYRITKSMELLKGTDMSITDIAVNCGFCGSSYFSETFMKLMKCTPSEFRKG